MKNQVPEDVKSRRLNQLQDLLLTNKREFNKSCVDTVMPVLLDRPGRKVGQLAGRSPYMQAVHVNAPARYMGEIVSLKIEEAFSNSLAAVIADFPSGPRAGMLERRTA